MGSLNEVFVFMNGNVVKKEWKRVNLLIRTFVSHKLAKMEEMVRSNIHFNNELKLNTETYKRVTFPVLVQMAYKETKLLKVYCLIVEFLVNSWITCSKRPSGVYVR